MRPTLPYRCSAAPSLKRLPAPVATTAIAGTKRSYRFVTSYGTGSDMSRHRACHLSHPTRQHGVVLFIALIVMVALSLAAIALIRSVDTTNAVVGNLAFRLSSILPANGSIEQGGGALLSPV